MITTLLGTLKIFTPKSFTGSDGKEVVYNECHIQYEDEKGLQQVMSLNTKQDLSGWEGVTGRFKLRWSAVSGTDHNGKPLKGVFKPSILGVEGADE